MRLLRSRVGQIVMPSLLLFPTLMLFVYLIYETAKLSREKIRHQFAMDAAVFVEMANYSDFLNRTAYVNGAFPMRIFDEGFMDFNTESEMKRGPSGKSYAQLLFENGAFPHLGGSFTDHHTPEGDAQFKNLGQWKIEYGYSLHDGSCATPGNNCQTDRTILNAKQPASLGGPFQFFSINDAVDFWNSYQLAFDNWKLYNQVYALLGSVEAAQFQVLNKLETGHQFLVKSWWLNTGDSDGGTLIGAWDTQMGGATAFDKSLMVYCQPTYQYCGNVLGSGVGIEPTKPVCTQGPQPFPVSQGCDGTAPALPKQDTGVFQLVFVKSQATLDAMASGKTGDPNASQGLKLLMPWKYPATNYFGVDWGSLGSGTFPDGGVPQVHSTISIGHAPGNTPAVWPDPTPKFQVRQFP